MITEVQKGILKLLIDNKIVKSDYYFAACEMGSTQRVQIAHQEREEAAVELDKYIESL